MSLSWLELIKVCGRHTISDRSLTAPGEYIPTRKIQFFAFWWTHLDNIYFTCIILNLLPKSLDHLVQIYSTAFGSRGKLWHVKRCNIRSFPFVLYKYSFVLYNFLFVLYNFHLYCTIFNLYSIIFNLYSIIFNLYCIRGIVYLFCYEGYHWLKVLYCIVGKPARCSGCWTQTGPLNMTCLNMWGSI